MLKSIKEYFLSKKNIQTILEKTILVLFSCFLTISLSLEAKRPFNFLNIGIFACLFVATIFYYFIYGFVKIKKDLYIFCVIGMAFCYLISYLLTFFSTPFPSTPLLMCFVSLTIYCWIKQNKDRCLNFVLASFISVGMFIIVFFVFEKNAIFNLNISKRAIENLGNPNDIAMNISFAMLLTIMTLFLFRNKLVYFISFVYIIILFYFLLITGSVSMLLLSFVILFISGYFLFPKKKRIFFLIGSICLISVAILLIFTIPGLSYFKERFLGIFALFSGSNVHRYDASAASRFYAAQCGFTLFKDSPLFGCGFDSVVRNYSIMPHNNISEIASNFGIFAIALEQIKLLFPVLNIKNIDNKCRPIIVSSCAFLFLLQFFLVFYDMKGATIFIPLLYSCFSYQGETVNKFDKRFKFSLNVKKCEVNI